MTKDELNDKWQYSFGDWKERFGSDPIEEVASLDLSEDYEMTAAHVFALENGQFALVTESGCSCYTASDADIDLYPTKEAAMEKFNEWKKENTREH